MYSRHQNNVPILQICPNIQVYTSLMEQKCCSIKNGKETVELLVQ